MAESRTRLPITLFLISLAVVFEAFWLDVSQTKRLFFIALLSASGSFAAAELLGGRQLRFPALYFFSVFFTTWPLAGLLFSWGASFSAPLMLHDLFDVLGERLLQADTILPDSVIWWEAFRTDRGSTTYFGPLPAFLRIILNFFVPRQAGEWTTLCMFFAAVSSVAAAAAMADLAVERSKPASLFLARVFCIAMPVAIGFTSPVLYLCSIVSVYHESILWGVAGSLWTAYLFMRAEEQADRCVPRFLFAGGVAATMLARLTFGLPWALALGVLALRDLFTADGDSASSAESLSRRTRFVAVWTLPFVAALSFVAWYNFNRFGSVLTVMPMSRYYFHVDEPARAVAVFDPLRVGKGAWHYFQVRNVYLSEKLGIPFPAIDHVPSYGLATNTHEPMTSFLLASLWLSGFAVLGFLRSLCAPRSFPQRVALLGLILEAFLILTYYFPSYRFAAEFIPGCVFLISTTAAYFLERRNVFLRVTLLLAGSTGFLYSLAANLNVTAMSLSTSPLANAPLTRWFAAAIIDLIAS